MDLVSEYRQGVRSDKFWKMAMNTRETQESLIEEQKTLHEEDGPMNNNLMSREVEVGSRVKSVAKASAYRI